MHVPSALAGIAAPRAAPDRLLSDTHLALIAATAVGVALCAFALLFAAYWTWRRQVFSASRAHRNLGIALSVAPALYLVAVLGAASLDFQGEVGLAPPLAILGLMGLLAWNWWRAGRERGLPSDPIWVASYSLFLTGCSALWILGFLLKTAAR